MAQAEHRLGLIKHWSVIGPGARILELGCGQGDCTAILAKYVGPSGCVDAVDPAPLDYGAPVTLGQAQESLSNSVVGDRIIWHKDDPEKFLQQAAMKGKTWDVAVLAHCIWYFQSPDTLGPILQSLKGRVEVICMAEYALHANHPAALPHVLSALARAGLEAHIADSNENIRTILSPTAIKDIATESEWKLQREAVLVPEPGLQDGFWETSTVLSVQFNNDIERYVKGQRAQAQLQAAQYAVGSAVATAGGLAETRTMDVWTGVFKISGKE